MKKRTKQCFAIGALYCIFIAALSKIVSMLPETPVFFDVFSALLVFISCVLFMGVSACVIGKIVADWMEK